MSYHGISSKHTKFIITLDWKTIATRQIQSAREAKHRRFLLDEAGQIEQLDWVLQHVELPEGLKKHCEMILKKLQTSPRPTEPEMADSATGFGTEAFLRRTYRLLLASQGQAPRDVVPATALQLATKAKLDEMDRRYEIKTIKVDDM